MPRACALLVIGLREVLERGSKVFAGHRPGPHFLVHGLDKDLWGREGALRA